MSSTRSSSVKTDTPSAIALKKISNEIIAECERRFRAEIKGAEKLQYPVLINSLPVFIENLAQALSHENPRLLASDSSTVAKEHGGERARLSQYSPEQLVREYQILRDAILFKLKSEVELTERDRSIIYRSLDLAVQQAMMAFSLAHSRIREQFMATLTHDLRNPLGVMKMAAEILLTRVPKISETESRLDIEQLGKRIVENAKRADRMIQDLLDSVVVQVGERMPLRIVECEILNVIESVRTDLDAKTQERIEVSGPSVRGYWDCEALRRALQNLITNAIKYGDAAAPITVKVELKEEHVHISVHNSGSPIPPGDLEDLFQVFRRSENAKRSGKKGWGIGLSLVRGVSEAHGGSILAESSRECGTTFTIDIPRDARPFQNSPTLQ